MRPFLIAAVISVSLTAIVYYCKTAIFAIAVCLIIFLIVALKLKNPHFTLVPVISILVFLSLLFSLYEIDRFSDLANTPITEDLVITETPESNEYYNFATAVCVSGNSLRKGDKIKIYYKNSDLSVGDTLNAEFALFEFESEKTRRYNFSEGIYAGAQIKSFGDSNNDKSILTFVPKLRFKITELLKSSDLTFQSRALISALTIGDRSSLDPKIYDNVKKSGVSHMLVVSGMHLVIIIGVFYSIFKPLLHNKYLYAAFSFLSVFLIVALCGFTMSVIRAGITYLLFSIAPLFSRERDALNSLSAAMIIMIFKTPFAVFSVSLQLSMLSTAGILILSPYLTEVFLRFFPLRKKFLKSLISSLSVTVSASLLTAPVCILVFGYISTVSILTNILVSFAVTAILSISVIAIGVGLVMPNYNLANIILCPAEILSSYTVDVINYLGSLKYSTLDVTPRLLSIVIILVVLIIALKYSEQQQLKFIKRQNI